MLLLPAPSHPADNVACCMVLHKVLASAVRALTLVLYLGALSMHLHAAEAAAATADLQPACLPGQSTHGPAKQPPRADCSGLHASTQVACKETLLGGKESSRWAVGRGGLLALHLLSVCCVSQQPSLLDSSSGIHVEPGR